MYESKEQKNEYEPIAPVPAFMSKEQYIAEKNNRGVATQKPHFDIFVAIPNMRDSDTRFWDSVIKMIMTPVFVKKNGEEYRMTVASPAFARHSDVVRARDGLVKEFLNTSAQYLMFIDDDMTFPATILHDFVNISIAHDIDILTATAFKKMTPQLPCGFYHYSQKEKAGFHSMVLFDAVMEQEATGLSCTLIRREVFEKMKTSEYYTRCRDRFFTNGEIGEDLAFTVAAKELGFKVAMSGAHPIGHIADREVITQEHYKEMLSTIQQAKATGLLDGGKTEIEAEKEEGINGDNQ